MSRHRLNAKRKVHFSPRHTEARRVAGLFTIVGGSMTGLACLACIYGGPVVDAMGTPPELSSAAPAWTQPPPLFKAKTFQPRVTIADFSVPVSGRLAGKGDGDRAKARLGSNRRTISVDATRGVGVRQQWGDAHQPHHERDSYGRHHLDRSGSNRVFGAAEHHPHQSEGDHHVPRDGHGSSGGHGGSEHGGKHHRDTGGRHRAVDHGSHGGGNHGGHGGSHRRG
jgi:hypothetical protein